MTPERSKAEADVRIRRALEMIENAQGQLGLACAELSAIVGGATLHGATSKMYDNVKAHWYRVDNFRRGQKFRLDDMTIEAIERRERFKGSGAANSADQLTPERQ